MLKSKPLVAVVGATSLARLAFSGLSLVPALVLTALLYLFLLLPLGCFTRGDLSWLATLFPFRVSTKNTPAPTENSV